jgi:hypothetical protein
MLQVRKGAALSLGFDAGIQRELDSLSPDSGDQIVGHAQAEMPRRTSLGEVGGSLQVIAHVQHDVQQGDGRQRPGAC